MFPDWPLDASIETIVTIDDVGGGTKVTVAHRVLPPDAAFPGQYGGSSLDGTVG
jgi:hypothetical protein